MRIYKVFKEEYEKKKKEEEKFIGGRINHSAMSDFTPGHILRLFRSLS